MLVKLLCIVLAIFVIWQLFTYLRLHPEAFSKENLNRSFFTIGILALLLIVFIAGLVWLVKRY